MSFLNFIGTVYYRSPPPPKKNENKQSTANKREKKPDDFEPLKQAFRFAKFLAENL